jgi:hypothetical protein
MQAVPLTAQLDSLEENVTRLLTGDRNLVLLAGPGIGAQLPPMPKVRGGCTLPAFAGVETFLDPV